MKKLLTLSFPAVILALCFSSCLKDECIELQEMVYLDPVVIPADLFRTDIYSNPGEALEQAGKIYVWGNLLLINDFEKGIHVVDNRNPIDPQFINFIGIQGNVDMIVSGSYLYADSYSDLLTIDVSDWMNPRLLHREEDVFNLHGWNEEGLIVRYDARSEMVEVDCNSNLWRGWDSSSPEIFTNNFSGNSGPSNSPQGIAGSMARLGITAGHLYGIDNRTLHVFGLENPNQPDRLNKIKTAWGIETLFPHENYLFIGGNRGMYIYDNSNPSAPTYLSEFGHANACDPVFVSGDRAYVTLRDGVECLNATNQLDVVDISDIQNPKLRKTYLMVNPHGLSIANSTLFLCDGRDGLKIYDVSDDLKIDQNQLSHIKSGHTFDVIARSASHIIVTGDNGIWQYDTSDPENPVELSFLAIKN